LLHWCLRPARLPIPPSGHNFSTTKLRIVFGFANSNRRFSSQKQVFHQFLACLWDFFAKFVLLLSVCLAGRRIFS
ncbi:MAG: hypothetical protein K2H58_08000, partial [Paramuribaculum sp.]|nr:hypothetical protein [Paramuribaculum sp.]